MDAQDWRGRVGDSWAAAWRRTDRSFAGLNAALVDAVVAAMPGGAARLVDIGCGAGETSVAIAAARPDAAVTGIDLSPGLVAVAVERARAAGLAGQCRFVVGDAMEVVAAEAPVDGFFSRHGVMFFADPAAAFARLAPAGKAGAPLVFSCFAAPGDNPWASMLAPSAPPAGPPPPGPFAFADPARVEAILAGSGWIVAAPPRRVGYRYVAGAGAAAVDDAVDFFSRIGPAARVLADADDDRRPPLLARLREACAARLEGDEVVFPASAWIWTARVG